MNKSIVKSIFRKLFWIALFVGLFVYFISVNISDSGDYKKLRIETRHDGYGFVVRMKPEGWELWVVEQKVETKRLFAHKEDFSLKNLKKYIKK